MRQQATPRALVCRLTDQTEWELSQQKGTVIWRDVDTKSAFLHLCAPYQVLETAQKHFSSQQTLIILMIEEQALGEKLKWEVAPRRGAHFPHYYGVLSVSLVLSTKTIVNSGGTWHWLEDK